MFACHREPVPFSLKVSPSSDTLAPGDTARFEAVVLDQRGEPVDVSVIWRSTDTSVLKVNQEGLAEALAEGAAYVVAQAEGLADSAFVLVKASFCPPLWVQARLWRLEEGATLLFEAREVDSAGAFVGGVRVILSSQGDTLLDTLTDYEPLVAQLGDVFPGSQITLRATAGYNDLEASGQMPGVEVSFESLPDTVPAGSLAVSWSLSGSAMAEELLGLWGWGLGGEAFYSRYWESVPLPTGDTLPAPQGPFTLLVSAVDVRSFSGPGSGGWLRLGSADTLMLYGR